MLRPASAPDRLLGIVLALTIVLILVSGTYALSTPDQPDQYTDFYLLTENESGELVADEFPQQLNVGDGEELTIGVTNNEHKTMRYGVVVLLQDVQIDDPTDIEQEETLGAYETNTIDHGESQHFSYVAEPTTVGENLRMMFLLYDGEIPDDPTRENAYRDIHIWVDVV